MIDSKIGNFGCGHIPKTEYFNIDDGVNIFGIDLNWDLNQIPYPLPNNRFEKIIASDVLEHLDDVIAIMNEWHRLLVPGGMLWLRVPDAEEPGMAWTDPTHKHVFTLNSFDYWDMETHYGKDYGQYYKNLTARFKIEEKRKWNRGLEFLLRKI